MDAQRPACALDLWHHERGVDAIEVVVGGDERADLSNGRRLCGDRIARIGHGEGGTIGSHPATDPSDGHTAESGQDRPAADCTGSDQEPASVGGSGRPVAVGIGVARGFADPWAQCPYQPVQYNHGDHHPSDRG